MSDWHPEDVRFVMEQVSELPRDPDAIRFNRGRDEIVAVWDLEVDDE